jgi:DNA-directed RNA polymerase subunit M/transcription elongation factor TFIIS
MNKKDREYIKNFDGINNKFDALLELIDEQTKVISLQNKTTEALAKQVNQLQKDKVDKNIYDSQIGTLFTMANEFYQFRDKLSTPAKTAIINCKKCNHATIHLINISENDKPTMTTCLSCGGVWSTTTKQVTEVKEIKK